MVLNTTVANCSTSCLYADVPGAECDVFRPQPQPPVSQEAGDPLTGGCRIDELKGLLEDFRDDDF